MPESKVIAIIPARGGSKGIPGKNLQKIGGRTLLQRAIESATASKLIDVVYVSTDDLEIEAEAKRCGAQVINRPTDLATDTSSSESALLHALKELESAGVRPDLLVFIQATSPFIDPADLDKAVTRVMNGEGDVCFSAFETFGFLWSSSSDGARGVNHDHTFRPRRQDREPHFQETGAFYVMKAAGFIEAGFRFFGKVLIQEVLEGSAIEIDSQEQLEIARAQSFLFGNKHIPKGSIKALVMDFDGVHTDDRAEIKPGALESVSVSRADGLGISMLKKANFPMLILSKEQNPVVSERANKLGIEVLQGIDNKLPELKNWCQKNNLELEDVCYMGNDINDLECLQAVGWPATPADAKPIVLTTARLVSSKNGGHGAVREICDLILGQLK